MTDRFLGDTALYPEEEDKIMRKVGDMEDPLGHYSKFIAPKLIGVEDKKKYILVTLSSVYDMEGDRGRINTLFHGSPGTGKSAVLRWIQKNLGGGYASKKTTEAGLVGDMSGSDATPGLLPRNHMGIAMVDELDKMAKKDREGLLECMSDGVVTLTGGGDSQEEPANTIVIAAVNDRDTLSVKLQQRFDFRIRFNYYDRETGEEIIESKSESFLKKKKSEEAMENFKKYLKTVRRFEVNIQDPDTCKEVLNEFLDINNVENVQPRNHIERFLRVGLAHARINFRQPKAIDFARAIELLLQDSFPELKRIAKEMNGDKK